jgi:hypothetical protein
MCQNEQRISRVLCFLLCSRPRHGPKARRQSRAVAMIFAPLQSYSMQRRQSWSTRNRSQAIGDSPIFAANRAASTATAPSRRENWGSPPERLRALRPVRWLRRRVTIKPRFGWSIDDCRRLPHGVRLKDRARFRSARRSRGTGTFSPPELPKSSRLEGRRNGACTRLSHTRAR